MKHLITWTHSLRTHFVFLRFLCVSLLSYAIDLILFISLYRAGLRLFSSLVVARIISALFNFSTNKYQVYRSKSRQQLKIEVLKYTLLATGLLFASYFLIRFAIFFVKIPIVEARILVDILLFLGSFFIQRYCVFVPKKC